MKQNEGWVNDIVQQIVEDESIIREKLLKEAALGGHKYLFLKKSMYLKNWEIKLKVEHFTLDDDETVNLVEEQGFEKYELDKVREYLKEKETDVI